jgi:hypothetical protein
MMGAAAAEPAAVGNVASLLSPGSFVADTVAVAAADLMMGARIAELPVVANSESAAVDAGAVGGMHEHVLVYFVHSAAGIAEDLAGFGCAASAA